MSFFLHVVPSPGESLNSFLMRMAELNGYGSAQALLSEEGLTLKVHYAAAELDRIANVFELSNELLAPWRVTAGHYLAQPRYLRSRCAAVCPACLAADGAVQAAWSHVLVTACPVHQVVLLAECPQCEGELLHTRHGLTQCDCGFDLRIASTLAASPFAVGLSALLADSPSPARQVLPSALDQIGYESALEDFLILLAKSHGRSSGALPARARFGSASSLSNAVVMVSCLEQLLGEWPGRFDTWLTERLSSGGGIGLAKRIGPWYRELFSVYTAPAFDFLRDQFKALIAEHFDGRLGLSTRALMFGNQDAALQWFSAAEAARLIGVAPDILANLIIQEMIPGRVHVEGKNRFVAIHRTSLDQVLADRQAYLSATEARQRLNVSKTFFERFVQAGGLRCYKRDERPLLVAGEYRRAEVDNVIATLVGRVPKTRRPSARGIGFQDISVKQGVSNAKIITVLQDILHGTIRPIAHAPGLVGLAGLQFDKAEIERRIRDHNPDVALSVEHLAQVSGWKASVIKKWIKGGHLKAVEERHGKARRHVVPVSALIQFLLEFVPTAELSKRLETKTNYLLMSLKPANVVCVVPPQEAGGAHRGLLVRIADLARGAQLRQPTLKELADQLEVENAA
jgi:hypothetical protein